ncbi:hypothetical protein Q73_10270 [Bacillus coahuilensis m2-6]|uniref:hypothetical protein n=1 Tax=Bacillus coahuilensis TaxID=408580 RepID=UPI0007506B5A|nr:hypothetical protein [Bacillus coahuilensis]KUP06969.1 hypothetical protein Q73_10270 [Bacillus coahuilensis m2-6]
MSEIQQEQFTSTASLQQKVPVKPITDQLLLNFEKAETVSDSYITKIEFTDGDVTTPLTIEEEIKEDVAEVQQFGDQDTQETVDSSEEPVEPVEGEGTELESAPTQILPEGLKKVTATLTVESATYFEMEKFLSVLENLQRIVEIEAITFGGYKDLIHTVDGFEPIEFKVEVSAYYLPTLEELVAELPQLDAPTPMNKRNPFSSYPSLTDEEVESSDSVTDETDTESADEPDSSEE